MSILEIGLIQILLNISNIQITISQETVFENMIRVMHSKGLNPAVCANLNFRRIFHPD